MKQEPVRHEQGREMCNRIGKTCAAFQNIWLEYVLDYEPKLNIADFILTYNPCSNIDI